MALTLKDRIRVHRVAARHSVTDDVRRAETVALCEHLRAIVGDDDNVAAYAPIETEPGYPDLPNALLDLGVRVLLPVARTTDDGTPLPLRWAELRRGGLQSAPFGLREPGGPWLAPGALATVRTIFVPALAVDRRGVRLGRGAGFYDRSLSFRDPAARMIAVVRDDELVDELPAEPHDVPMTNALTPRRGLVVFP
ncbi:MAG: 5-formyltetrahydrofolate cyclo-ligase [Mycobacterium sp.]|nr:5-formyltetrahydrofolate cyclo-ligase [Mycobacterium sp.]